MPRKKRNNGFYLVRVISNGRVTLPPEVRENLNVSMGDPLALIYGSPDGSGTKEWYLVKPGIIEILGKDGKTYRTPEIK